MALRAERCGLLLLDFLREHPEHGADFFPGKGAIEFVKCARSDGAGDACPRRGVRSENDEFINR